MNKKLYVGNLPFGISEESLSEAFAACGTVESAKIITDRDSGRSKGFGFVEMSSTEEAESAIDKLDGHEYDGRPMRVNMAKPKAPRDDRSSSRRF